ncbi:MFS transporter [Micromonospora sp. DT228]|uniref:MFS transporter n=1 Tax=Micromonospora sp. DT228 TaxID=3393443 RepID=UPI003CF2E95F
MPKESSGAGGLLRRNDDFRRLWTADSLSRVGTQVSALALPLAAAQTLDASTLEMAMLTALQTIAFVVIGLPVGAWVERMRCRPLIIVADLGRALVLATVPVAALLDVLTMWQLYVVALTGGVFTVFSDVAFQSYVPAVVDRQFLVEANSRIEANRTIATTTGPVLAGYLVQWLTAPIAVVVDAASFLWSSAWVAGITTAEAEPARAPGTRLGQQIAEGLRFVFAQPVIRALACYNGTAMLLYSAQGAVEVLFLLRDVQVPASTIGLLFAGGSLGSLLGALCSPRLTRAIGRHRALPLYAVIAGLGALLLPVTSDGWRLALFSISAAVSGFCLIAYNVVQISLRQELCPPHLLGRMSATMRTVSSGAAPLGALVGGALGTWLGIRPTLWLTAAGASLASLWLLPIARSTDLPSERLFRDGIPVSAPPEH